MAVLDPQIRAQILSKAYTGIPNSQIWSSLRIEHPQILITKVDITNIIQAARLKSLAGRTPIQWLLLKLEEQGFNPAYSTNPTNNLVNLFYVHPERFFPLPVKENGIYKRHPIFQEFLKLWGVLLDSPSFEAYTSNLTKLRAYPNATVQYVENTWLIPWKEKLVRYWVDQHHHFGVLVTSPIEGCHSTLKSYLQRGNGDLNDVFERLLLFWASQQNNINTTIAQEQLRRKHHINIHLFSAILGQVYDHALEKLVVERAKIPKSATLDITELPILNPQVVKGKGRPKGAWGKGRKLTTNTISGTKRLSSAFELPSSSAPPALEASSSRELAEGKEIYITRSGCTAIIVGLQRIQEIGQDTYEPGTAWERGYQRGISSIYHTDSMEETAKLADKAMQASEAWDVNQETQDCIEILP
ncbi:hypothetical protein B7463_g9536, partial [Scytalidium lignicola]